MPAPPLALLLATATALCAARWGAAAALLTLDASAWTCGCVDPDAPGALLPELPSRQGPTPEGAARALLDHLHELNLADALGPEPSPVPGDDPRFDADGRPARSLADAFPPLAPPRRAILPAAVTLTAEGDLVDAATREVLLPGLCDEAAAEPELRRAEVA